MQSTTTSKPTVYPLQSENIPHELKEHTQWLCWKWTPKRNGNGGWDKPPTSAITGKQYNGEDTDGLTTFKHASDCVQLGRYDGVGFRFIADQDYAGVDLDDSVNEEGNLLPWAQDIVQRLNSYTEISPSGRGVKIYLRGTLPKGRRAWHDRGIEMYDGGRYFCVTGRHVTGTPGDIMSRQDELTSLHIDLVGSEQKNENATAIPNIDVPTEYEYHDDVATVRAALDALHSSRANEYSEWLRVGMALHAIDEELLSEWDMWSQSSNKYAPGECAQKWTSFGGGDISGGTLYHMAQEDGWQPPTIDEKWDIAEGNFIRSRGGDPDAHREALQTMWRQKAQQEAIQRTLTPTAPPAPPAVSPMEYFGFINADDLLKMEVKTDYLVKGILAEGQCCMLAGSFKTLKTTIAMDLAVSVATGRDFLDKFPVPKAAPVLFFSAESGLPKLKDTQMRVMKWKMVAGVPNLYMATRVPQLGNMIDVDTVAGAIDQSGCRLVIVDPLYLAIPGDIQNNASEAGKVLLPLAKMCQDKGVTLVLVHHFKKSSHETYAMPDLGDLSGAGHSAFTRQWILLARRRKYQADTGFHQMWMSVGGSEGHGGEWGLDCDEGPYVGDQPGSRQWFTQTKTVQEARDEAKREKEVYAERKEQAQAEALKTDRENIRAFLMLNPDSTVTEMRKHVRGKVERLAEVWSAMIAEGEIVDGSKIKKANNQTYQGYRLSE